MRTFFTMVGVASLVALGTISSANAESFRLSDQQLDSVTASGGQIASIGPAKAKAAKSTLPTRGAKRRGGQITSI